MRQADRHPTLSFQRGFLLFHPDHFPGTTEALMEREYTNRRYLDALKERVLIFDGAMGTNLQKMNLTAYEFGGERTVGCNDYLVLSYPLAPLTVHRSFLEAGVDVIETCTFRSNRLTLGEYGLADKVDLINRNAASIARKVADEFSTPAQPRFVAGSIGPSGKLPSMNDPELSNISIEDLIDLFREQATGLIEGGVDLLLIETSQDILEVRVAIQGIWKAFEQTGVFLPIQAQVTLDTSGRMLLGTDISAVLAILEDLSIDVIGLNCSTGPEHMREPIQYLGAQSRLPVSCIPNAGLPLNVDGEAVYPLTPEEFATALGEFVEKYHINVVGGCCGTTPDHLQKLVERIHGRPNLPRPVLNIPLLASGIQAQPMLQEPRPFLIGERLNTQGSAKFKQIILDQNYDGILSIARQQVNSGAHGLDLCVALTERSDEAESMRRAVKVLAPVMRIPLVIDSTEPEVMETALKNYPGRCLLNSINLEAGEEKASRILSLAKKYNAAVIALTIDEQGMAKTAERKLEVARRIHALAVDKYGLHPQDIVFDALTFTLATGDPEYSQSAVDTFEGIRQIKSNLPGVLTSLGVSNVSFGLDGPTRAVLNSLMLYHSVLAGLDMAIVNPAQITPYAELSAEERELGEDLIFNRNPDALKNLIGYFQKLPADSGRVELQKSELADMSPQERLHFKILHRLKEGVDLDIDEIVTPHPLESRHAAAIEVLNTVLLPAMKEVGDKFGSGELILPFVLQSAEVMKASVTHLEQYLEKMEGVSKGKVVLATVYGDVHDIGKNLVKTILSNNGYEVIDLGKQVPADIIITRAVEEKADAIGLSALLVSTSRQMPLIVNELSLRKLNFPVLIGGAAINRRFGRRILQVEDGSFYPGGVFYCKDAFEGLSTMDQLSDKTRRPLFQEENQIESQVETGKESSSTLSAISVVKSTVSAAEFIPRPPAWGPKVVHAMPLEEVFNLLSIKELFRLSWGAKNAHGDVWKKMEEKFVLRLENMKKEALQTGWLRPQGVYGYFPCQADGNDLIIFEPGSVEAGSPLEFKRFSFPRQPDQEHLCLADYFLPVASGKMDVVALQVVTVGREATERIDALNSSGEITEAYFAHGLAVQTAEASANYLHLHIRRELGMSPNQGKRYSWGYPAIPDLSDHAKVFELLPVENALGMRLTSAFQLIPEQSTAAIIVHHPAASYFNVAVGRSE
jgi:5-methyltetrahydrofolate--homocysteine methyltransferase